MTSPVPPIRTPAGPAAPPSRCRECGEVLPADARFCAACGASQSPSAVKPGEVPVRLGVASGFRFGVGFLLAAALFGVVSFLVSLVVAGSLFALLLGGVTSLGSTGASTFEGSGTTRSEPFRLSGDVEVTWQATTISPAGCHLRAHVALDATTPARELVADLDVATAESGTYLLRGLREADYLIDVDSDCHWSFRLSRR